MLSIAAMGPFSIAYHTKLASADYYLGGGEPPGQWRGRGARSLGLRGTVTEKDFVKLFQGYGPDGRPLVKNAGQSEGFHARKPGWDLAFSAPKSVSYVWSQADEKTRRQIQRAHDAAVNTAIGYLESDAAVTRSGKAGVDQVPVRLVVATFEHGTSRALDPQLHTHAIVFNIGVRADGQTGALKSHPLYAHKMAAGALYRVELSRQLMLMGYELKQTRSWFEIVGVGAKVLKFFSTRRSQIESILKSRNLETASAAAAAALDTRQLKEVVPPRSELFTQWQSTARTQGFGAPRRTSGHAPHADPDQVMRDGVRRLASGSEVFTEVELLEACAVQAQGSGLTADEVRRAVRTTIDRGVEVILVGQLGDQACYTTPEAQGRHRSLVESAVAASTNDSACVPVDMVDRYFRPRSAVHAAALGGAHHIGQIVNAAAGRPTRTLADVNSLRSLSTDQAEAVRLLTTGPGNVKILTGPAGTGKTRAIGTCREMWERHGVRVVGVALGGKAARELHEGAGIESYTLAMLQTITDPSIGKRARHGAKQLIRAAFGKPTFHLDSMKLGRGTVLVVDEAGMLGTAQFQWLMDHHVSLGGVLVCSGDDQQLPPIESGFPFASLIDKVPTARLTTLIRQKDPLDQEAASLIREGKAAEAIENYRARGRLFAASDPSTAKDRLVQDWSMHGLKKPGDCLILCSTNEEAREMNRRCQEARVAAGRLFRMQGVTVDGTRFLVGDRVVFRKPSAAFGVENGATGTITSIGTLGSSLNVRLSDGRRISVPTARPHLLRRAPHYWVDDPEESPGFGVLLGYAMTTARAQGTTTKYAFLNLDGVRISRQMAYVQATRATDTTRLYTGLYHPQTKLQGLISRMNRSETEASLDAFTTAEPTVEIPLRRSM